MIASVLALLLLSGCGRQTQVWLPAEEVVELQGKDVVRIPVKEATEAASSSPEEAPQITEPQETRPVMTEKTTVTKKTTTTTKKNTGKGSNQETVTGSGKQDATEPPATEPPSYDISNYRTGDLEYEMLNRINEYRSENWLDELALDTRLCAIASYRSFEASRVWSHTRPDGRHFSTVLTDYGYGAGGVQELLVYDTGAGNGTAIVDRWMESNSKESLLGDYTTAGIGGYRVDGLVYVTCLLVK